LFILLVGAFACEQPAADLAQETNPAAPGFDLNNSDPKAIAIADACMEAMGGREAWDKTKVLAWNFFGSRHLVWNKQTGDVRIDSHRDTSVLLTNLFSGSIRAEVKGEEIVDPDSLAMWKDKAKASWINDAYWLIMPFKLKDSGVTLKYMREDTTEMGIKSDVLQLTFENVGNTPNNKYEIWVDQSDQLVKQWSFYRDANQTDPPVIWPWDNYQEYGDIKLSAERSDGKGPKFVQVLDTVPATVFTDFEVPSLVRF